MKEHNKSAIKSPGNDWVKMVRQKPEEPQFSQALMCKNHSADVLLRWIALRTWRGPGTGPQGCRAGEAYIGDWADYGFTQTRYRVAKKQLAAMGFASFRTNTYGTVARLLTAEVYSIEIEPVAKTGARITERINHELDDDFLSKLRNDKE